MSSSVQQRRSTVVVKTEKDRKKWKKGEEEIDRSFCTRPSVRLSADIWHLHALLYVRTNVPYVHSSFSQTTITVFTTRDNDIPLANRQPRYLSTLSIIQLTHSFNLSQIIIFSCRSSSIWDSFSYLFIITTVMLLVIMIQEQRTTTATTIATRIVRMLHIW
jgi:hypothetical protein